MNDIVSKRELMAFGAYLADTDGANGIRDRLTSSDFIDNDLVKCIEEMENVTSGKTKKEDMRFLPFLLESLRCSNGGKAIDGIEQTTKKQKYSGYKLSRDHSERLGIIRDPECYHTHAVLSPPLGGSVPSGECVPNAVSDTQDTFIPSDLNEIFPTDSEGDQF
ncbi:MAG: hypothetical protein K0U90_08435 [Planctomycetes bacterium]|nr:hypothetical protein [Planctomycetota bacterium]